MQNEIKKPQLLLDDNGQLRTAGWARDLILDYNRSDIKAPLFRIKEWDYYLIGNESYAVALTVADNGYMGLVSASLIDFRQPIEHTKSIMIPFTMGRFSMPSTSKSGDVTYTSKAVGMNFSKAGNKRYLKCEYINFYNGKNLYVNLTLDEPEQDTIVMATPFDTSKKHFYYNQKINCMPATGIVRCGGDEYTFSPENSFGTLDWGRGVWPYRNKWYWSSASSVINGIPFGFNLGYGFGNLSAATENIIFYNGVGHKLDKVTFHIPKGHYLKPWVVSSSDGRFEMEFHPIIDRAAKSSVGIVSSDQHQVFGRFTGQMILDDGKPLRIKNLPGFAEKVVNKW